MSDHDLIAFVWPGATAEEAALFLKGITPEKRATFERMAFVADELNAGRIPPGVMVD
jgi:hypothetical protein